MALPLKDCQNLPNFIFKKPLAQELPSFVKDTTHLLNKIKEFNDKGPFPDGTLLVSWDVFSMFPNIDNSLGIRAVTQALNSRPNLFPSTECIVEAVSICLENNNSQFLNQNFLQIHGTAMGPKNSCSYADLAMGEIDKLAKSNPNLSPENWLRYRDDIFDIWKLGYDKLMEFTDFLNNLYPTIKFTLVFSEKSINVLDLKLTLENGFIQTDVYSKPTDNQIYLHPKSVHPAHCMKAIPFGVASRLRRNCSSDEALQDKMRGISKLYAKKRVQSNTCSRTISESQTDSKKAASQTGI